jgi:hypothetical protein
MVVAIEVDAAIIIKIFRLKNCSRCVHVDDGWGRWASAREGVANGSSTGRTESDGFEAIWRMFVDKGARKHAENA